MKQLQRLLQVHSGRAGETDAGAAAETGHGGAHGQIINILSGINCLSNHNNLEKFQLLLQCLTNNLALISLHQFSCPSRPPALTVVPCRSTVTKSAGWCLASTRTKDTSWSSGRGEATPVTIVVLDNLLPYYPVVGTTSS